MNKTIQKLFCVTLALMMILLSACGSTPAQTPASSTAVPDASAAVTAPSAEPGIAAETEEMRTIVDLDGNEILVPVHPMRVAVLPDAICSLAWQLMGGGERMADLTESSKNQWSNFLGCKIFPDMDSVPVGLELNAEELMALDPDLVIGMSGEPYYEDINNALTAMGVQMYIISHETFYNDPVTVIRSLGDLLNCEDRAAQLIGYMQETDTFVKERMKNVENTGLRLYNIVHVDSMGAWTAGSINAGIISSLQCENISDDPASTTTFTMEEIIAYDPEVVFISFAEYTPQAFYDNEVPGQDWTPTSAAKNHQIYRAPSLLQSWAQSFSTEKFLYKRWMAAMTFPEAFPMDEFADYTRAYLKDFYGYEISQEELDYCLNTEINGLK